MRRRLQFVLWLVPLLLAALAAEPALAQRGGQQGKRPPQKGERLRPGKQPGKSPGANIPQRWMNRLQRMSPQEQERFLRNNRRFRNLPEEQQAEIRRRLRQWNNLSPEQQRAIRERLQRWQQLSPEQRQRIRREILPRWQSLPPERRQPLLRRLRVLREMGDEERAAKLQDEEFLKGLNAEDRRLLRELAELRIGPPE